MVYEARPINYIIELWEGCLKEAQAEMQGVRMKIETLSSCIEGLKRNLKETPRPVSAEELAELTAGEG